MPEDVTKMKVADLKRELKLRGLITTGNKNDLQDRLQTALIDGDELLEGAISGEEELLTDEEEEAKILGADENELLKSPVSTPTVPDLTPPGKTNITSAEADILESPAILTSSKKILLKRKNSFTAISGSIPAANNTSVPKSDCEEKSAEPVVPKVAKMSERNPITMNSSNTTATNISATASATTKVSQLSLKERMEMRAKKFGINAKSTSTDTTDGTTIAGDTNEKQVEVLKKRAERFGVVSIKMAEIDAKEKLQKRQERFGGAAATPNNNGKSDDWAEKARLRLKRFNATAPENSKPVVATAATTAPANSN